MKVRLLAASIALFTLCGLAVAQEYCITANRRINLRDAAGLEGNVLETVATGTTLSVIGELNRWLKINRNGNEVWMANWVDYSRVENCGGTGSPQGTSAGTASDIDNCCFVDRQCDTDQDWTDGYWAFQNNQCSAPAQSGAPTSAQPVSEAPAQIDNCCFVDRQCSSDQDWADGYHAFQNKQCRAPGQSVNVSQADNERRAMRIEGSAEFIASVNASMDLLKARAPYWYEYLVFGLDWILELPDGTIVRSPGDVNVWIFGEDWTYLYIGHTVRFAGVLVHEACHAYQQQRGLASGAGINAFSTGLEAERECLTLEIEVLEDCCPGYSALPGKRHTLANIDKPENQWWHGCDYVWWHGMEEECD